MVFALVMSSQALICRSEIIETLKKVFIALGIGCFYLFGRLMMVLRVLE